MTMQMVDQEIDFAKSIGLQNIENIDDTLDWCLGTIEPFALPDDDEETFQATIEAWKNAFYGYKFVITDLEHRTYTVSTTLRLYESWPLMVHFANAVLSIQDIQGVQLLDGGTSEERMKSVYNNAIDRTLLTIRNLRL